MPEREAGGEERPQVCGVAALIRHWYVQVRLGGQRIQQHIGLRRPPAVDGLLAGARSGRDPFDRETGVADLADELVRRGEDRQPAFLAALAAWLRGDGLV